MAGRDRATVKREDRNIKFDLHAAERGAVRDWGFHYQRNMTSSLSLTSGDRPSKKKHLSFNYYGQIFSALHLGIDMRLNICRRVRSGPTTSGISDLKLSFLLSSSAHSDHSDES